MADIMTLEALVRPYVKDCPSIIIEQALIRAARQFCEQTFIWKVEKLNLVIPANTGLLTLPPSASTDNIHFIKARLVGATQDLDRQDDEIYLHKQQVGEPLAFVGLDENRMQFAPIPATDTLVNVTVAVKPKLDSTTVKDEIVTGWPEAMRYGALKELQNEEGYNWSNPVAAMSNEAKFWVKIAEARSKIEMGYTNSEPTVTGGRFI